MSIGKIELGELVRVSGSFKPEIGIVREIDTVMLRGIYADGTEFDTIALIPDDDGSWLATFTAIRPGLLYLRAEGLEEGEVLAVHEESIEILDSNVIDP